MNYSLLSSYLEAGLPVVPVDGKNPGVGGASWHTKRYSPADLARWQAAGHGVGLLLGPVSGYVDFDPDGPRGAAAFELLKIAHAEPLASCAFRSSKGIHHVFKVRPEHYAQLNETVSVMDRDPETGKDGLEIRWARTEGKGLQTVIPPSEGRHFLPDSPDLLNAPYLPADFIDLLPKKEHKEYVPQLDGETDDKPLSRFSREVAEDLTVFATFVLDKLNYTYVGQNPAGGELYKHPAATQKQSLVIGHTFTPEGIPHVYSYSPNCNGLPQNEAVTPHRALALMLFDGDYNAAARYVLKNGHGDIERNCSEFDEEPATAFVNDKQTEGDLPAVAVDSRPSPDNRMYDNVIGEYALDLHKNWMVEADPAAIFMQALEIFGCLLGREVWVDTEEGPVYGNNYLVVVGNRATGRKGTGWKHAKTLYAHDDFTTWVAEEFSGLLRGRMDSGEGMVKALIDISKQNGNEFSDTHTTIKMLSHDSEFIGTINKGKIDGSTLLHNFTKAWEGTGFGTAKTKEQAYVKRPHITLIGHVQPEPLKLALTQTMDDSGFLSRIQFIFTERARINYDPPRMQYDILENYHNQIVAILNWAKAKGVITYSREAYQLIKHYYETDTTLLRNHRFVLKNMMRLACLRQSTEMSVADVDTAMKIQAYVDACTKLLFKDWGLEGAKRDDQDKIISYIAECPGSGNTSINRYLFGNNKKHSEIESLMAGLISANKVVLKKESTKGRPKMGYYVV